MIKFSIGKTVHQAATETNHSSGDVQLAAAGREGAGGGGRDCKIIKAAPTGLTINAEIVIKREA